MGRSRGGQVARYISEAAVYPTALHFSGEGDLTPITIHYDAPAYKKGGLVKHALAVSRAGRHGDTELIHVNKEELEELRSLWGEPTINPETGLPEYFLKKLWKGVKKIAKPLASIAPIAAAFIPGIGPLAAAAIGAGSGLLGGKGLKGALLGGVTGALGAGALGGVAKGAGAASKVASTAADVGKVADVASDVAGIAPVVGDAAKLADVAKTGTSLGGTLGKIAAPMALNSLAAPEVPGKFDQPVAAPIAPTVGQGGGGQLPTQLGQYAPLPPSHQPQKPNFWNQNFLGIKGLPNKYGMPLGMLAAFALSKGGGGGGDPLGNGKWKNYLASDYDEDLPEPGASFRYAKGGEVANPDDFAYERAPWAFDGQDADTDELAVFRGHDAARKAEGGVAGEGTGRSDHIPAYLSDGEYVIDAETVAMLGDGSSKAGAKKLDDFRVSLRKHKGKNLSKGKFSSNAKSVDKYMVKR